MKKQLLLCLSFLMINAFTIANAQTGSINIVSIQSPINAGTSGAVEVTYTSDVVCDLFVQLRQTNPNLNTPDYGVWHGQTSVTALAATNVPTTVMINYAVVGSQGTSASLPSGVQYTFAFELKPNSGGSSYGFNNGQTANLVTINPSSTVVDNLNISSGIPTTISAGSDLTVDFDYTLVDDGEIKVEVRKYDGTTYLSGGLIVESYINPAVATTTTPVVDSKTLTIPAGTALSSSLTGNENYKVSITLYKAGYTYILAKTSDLTITSSLGVEDIVKNALTFYPNPVSDMLLIKSNGGLQAKAINIIDVMGRTVRTIQNVETLKSIDVSNLKNGVYFIKTDTNQHYKFVKK